MSSDNKHFENSIKAFIFLIFSLYDRRVSVSEILPYLVENGLQMRFPGYPEIHNKSNFEDWYRAAAIQSNTHEVKILRLEVIRDGEYEVDLYVQWKAVMQSGTRESMRTIQHWEVIEADGTGPQIRRHSAIAL